MQLWMFAVAAFTWIESASCAARVVAVSLESVPVEKRVVKLAKTGIAELESRGPCAQE
jgi:hypothetical protein